MPTIFEPKDLPVKERTGFNITTLANQAMLGTDALQVQRVALEADARSESFKAENAERFMYVVRGKGRAIVDAQILPLAAESMLWLEKGDSFSLEASAEGIEVLLCHAPVSE